jgi:hypothetical protein
LIADLAPARLATSPAADDETTDLAEMAFVWATLNALDCTEVDPVDAAVVRAAHATLRHRLDAAGLTSADMFEHIADAAERGDWAALGFTDEPD